MKKIFIGSFILILVISSFPQCKSLAKAAARYWTKQQIKEFKTKCNKAATRADKLIKNADDFCNCAADKISDQYHNYKDAEKLSGLEIVQRAIECSGEN